MGDKVNKIDNLLVGVLFPIVIVGCTFIGLYLGEKKAEHNTHYSVYTTDLNEDGRQDIIVKSRDGNRYIFLQQTNGDYVYINKIVESEKRDLENRKKDIENKMKNIELKLK